MIYSVFRPASVFRSSCANTDELAEVLTRAKKQIIRTPEEPQRRQTFPYLSFYRNLPSNTVSAQFEQ
jgi:hypothetical protein